MSDELLESNIRANQSKLRGAAAEKQIPPEIEHLAGELGSKMGIVITELSPERVVGTMPVEGNRQPFGLLHGGANGVLVESLASIHAILLAGVDKGAVGLELNCTHHRAVRAGSVSGVSTPVHIGRQVMVFDVALTDSEGRRTCTGRMTCLALGPR